MVTQHTDVLNELLLQYHDVCSMCDTQMCLAGRDVPPQLASQQRVVQAAGEEANTEQTSPSGDGASQQDMDLQKALKIVSKHYVSRNITRITLLQWTTVISKLAVLLLKCIGKRSKLL